MLYKEGQFIRLKDSIMDEYHMSEQDRIAKIEMTMDGCYFIRTTPMNQWDTGTMWLENGDFTIASDEEAALWIMSN